MQRFDGSRNVTTETSTKKRRPTRQINRQRRAEIGAERRSQTRAEILEAAVELFGQPHGRNTRIEDVCAKARIARGTFYNYFTGIEALLEALSEELTRDFDAAVHTAFEELTGPLERTSAAIRYYLHAAVRDPRWGWAIANSSVGHTLYGDTIMDHVRESIQEGIDSGDFALDSALIGRDILLGTGISATISLLNGGTPAEYPERIARQVLLALGASPKAATAATARPMRELPPVTTTSPYFRGTLGGGQSPNSARTKGPLRPAGYRSAAGTPNAVGRSRRSSKS